jgi:hypothetical protein
MTVAIQPPLLLPQLGFFDLMRKADVFILLDRARFEERESQNRARIKADSGTAWLTVPVIVGTPAQRIADMMIDNGSGGSPRWPRGFFRALRQAYQKAPFFHLYASDLEDILTTRWERLVDLDRELMTFVAEALDIRKPVIMSSGLPVTGHNSRLLLKLCQLVGADRLLDSGDADRNLADTMAFLQGGVRVVPQDFHHPSYSQLSGQDAFIEELSALDLIFNCGPESAGILEGRAVEYAGYAE